MISYVVMKQKLLIMMMQTVLLTPKKRENIPLSITALSKVQSVLNCGKSIAAPINSSSFSME